MSYLTKNILLGFGGLIIIFLLMKLVPVIGLRSNTAALISVTLLIIGGLFLKRTNNFTSGQVGELDVWHELKKLPDGYFVIDDLNTGRGNIDKVVIGPTGIWTLEVKSYKGNISPNEHDLKQAYAEAKTLQDLISSKLNLHLNVEPVLVFSDKFAKVRFGLNKQKGVYVIGIAWLNKLLTENNTTRLDREVVYKIKEILM